MVDEKKTVEIDPKDQETKKEAESKNEPCNLLTTPKPAGSVSKLTATPSNPDAKPVTPASVRSALF